MEFIHDLIQIPRLGFIILLLPYSILMILAYLVLKFSVQGGTNRFAGGILCPILGILCAWIGWWTAFIGYPEASGYVITYPIAGWIGIVVGSLCVLVGTPIALFGSPAHVESIAQYFEESDNQETGETYETTSQEPGKDGFVMCLKCGLENWKGYDKCEKCGEVLRK